MPQGSPMTQSGASVPGLRETAIELANSLDEAIINRDKAGRSELWFVPIEDLRRIISRDAVRCLLGYRVSPREGKEDIRLDRAVDRIVGPKQDDHSVSGEYTRVLAILIYCSGMLKLAIALDSFLGYRADRMPKDDQLPLEDGLARTVFGMHGSHLQYIFSALVLKKDENKDMSGKLVRLPLIGEPFRPARAQGASGVVSIVKIARRHWVDGIMSNDDPKELALKDFSRPGRPNDEVKEAFHRELTTLSELKAAPTQSKGIMLHVASLVTSDRCLLFYEPAEGDLQEYFCRIDLEPRTWSRKVKANLLANATNLVGALAWLHTYRPHHAVYHFDIRPQNILVLNETGEQVFKLADFDLAYTYKQDNDPSKPAKKDPRDFSSVPTKLDINTYRAPEFAGGRAGHKSDVWSIGCIVSKIVTFLDKGSEGVNEFDERRVRNSDLMPDRWVDYYYQENEVAGQFQGVAKQVCEWFDILRKNASEREAYEHTYFCWLTDYLRERVFVEKKNRADSRTLYEAMDSRLSLYKGQEVEASRLLSSRPVEHILLPGAFIHSRPPSVGMPVLQTPVPSPRHLSAPPTPPPESPIVEQPPESPHMFPHNPTQERPHETQPPPSLHLSETTAEVAQPPNSCSPWCEAIRHKDESAVKRLLDTERANINHVCDEHGAPLHIAIESYEGSIFGILLEAEGINVDVPCGGHEPLIECLLLQKKNAAIALGKKSTHLDMKEYKKIKLPTHFKKDFEKECKHLFPRKSRFF